LIAKGRYLGEEIGKAEWEDMAEKKDGGPKRTAVF